MRPSLLEPLIGGLALAAGLTTTLAAFGLLGLSFKDALCVAIVVLTLAGHLLSAWALRRQRRE